MPRNKASIAAGVAPVAFAGFVAVAGCTPVEMRGDATAARTCDAAPAQAYVGHAGEAGAIEAIRRASGARTARIVRPGEMMTMDVRPDRITVTVDGHRIITRAACG